MGGVFDWNMHFIAPPHLRGLIFSSAPSPPRSGDLSGLTYRRKIMFRKFVTFLRVAKAVIETVLKVIQTAILVRTLAAA